MLTSSERLERNAEHITIQLNSNPIEMPPLLRSPIFSRKGGKRDKTGESIKSSGEKSLQKSFRYTKIMPRQQKNEDSDMHSEVNIIRMLSNKMEDSEETVIHQNRSRSHTKMNLLQLNLKMTSPKRKSPGKKVLEDLSCMDPTRKSRLTTKNDEHYLYWKSKAYEYLQANIKLMDEVRKLTRENENLKTTITDLQVKLKEKGETRESGMYSEKEFNREVRNISSFYISKIESMEKELKRKQISIATYQIKVDDLNSRLTGDIQRVRLITTMQQEIENLKNEVQMRKAESKVESRLYQSTSILVPQHNGS